MDWLPSVCSKCGKHIPSGEEARNKGYCNECKRR